MVLLWFAFGMNYGFEIPLAVGLISLTHSITNNFNNRKCKFSNLAKVENTIERLMSNWITTAQA